MVNCIVHKFYLQAIMRKIYVDMTDYRIIVERRGLGNIKNVILYIYLLFE